MAAKASELIAVGKVGGAFGVKGWLKIVSHTEPVDSILQYSTWYLQLDGDWQQHKLIGGRRHGKGVVANLAHCNDRNQAAKWVGATVAVVRADMPALPEDQYYWADLIGLAVHTSDGLPLGKVEQLIATGANDVLVVVGERERLIPYIKGQVVEKIDLENRRIVVDWDPDF